MGNYRVIRNEELYHFGIKGQRWGRRRWQEDDGSYNEEGLERYFGHGKEHKKIGKEPTSTNSSDKSSSEKKKFALSDKQKKALKIGAAVAVTAVAAYKLHKLSKALNNKGTVSDGKKLTERMILNRDATIDDSAVDSLSISDKLKGQVKQQSFIYRDEIEFNLKQHGAFSDLSKITSEHSKEQDMALINPNWNDGKSLGYNMNCTMCSTAYELRRRGYDVEAGAAAMGRWPRDIASYFKTEPKTVPDFEDIVSELKSMPDGARGQINAACGPLYANHCVVWEKEGDNIVIRDCQSNKVYNDISDSIINKDGGLGFTFFRTDNAEIDEAKIMDAVQKAQKR